MGTIRRRFLLRFGRSGVWVEGCNVLFPPHRFTRTRDLMTEFAGRSRTPIPVAMLIFMRRSGSRWRCDASALVKRYGLRWNEWSMRLCDGAVASWCGRRSGDVIFDSGGGEMCPGGVRRCWMVLGGEG